jgi:ABC-type Mn2+/Zn2+ transport system permease subunit
MTEIFHPDFLLRNALWSSVAVGLFCPLIGVYFMLRRMIFLGVALPQISTAGVSFIFLLQGLGILAEQHTHEGHGHGHGLALAGSLIFSVVALLVLAFLERRGERTTESRFGATYALAFAASILFVAFNAEGNIEILNMLHGEIVSVSGQDIRWLLMTFAALTAGLWVFHRQFLLVSFDRDSARVMGKNVIGWDVLLYGMIGLAISMGVLIVGPMVVFSFLVIPPLAARRFVKRMSSFFTLAALIGGISGTVGFYVSYRFDLPLGPTDTAVATFALGVALLVSKLLELKKFNQSPVSAETKE